MFSGMTNLNAHQMPLSWWWGDGPGRFAPLRRPDGAKKAAPPAGGFLVTPGEYLPYGEPEALRLQAAAASGLPAAAIIVTPWGYPPAVHLADVARPELPPASAAGSSSALVVRGGSRRAFPRWVPTSMCGWPAFWLPEAVLDRRAGEPNEVWAVRMFFELVARELLDANTMTATDVVARAGVDVRSATGAARFDLWRSGARPDPDLDTLTVPALRRRSSLADRLAGKLPPDWPAVNADRLAGIHAEHIATIDAELAAARQRFENERSAAAGAGRSLDHPHRALPPGR